MIRPLAFFCILSAPALAGVACPATSEGRHLARNDGGNLYVGDPSQHLLVAPDQQARSMSGQNVWHTAGAGVLTLVCRYEGTTRALAVRLPSDVRQCTQNLAANTFACQ